MGMRSINHLPTLLLALALKMPKSDHRLARTVAKAESELLFSSLPGGGRLVRRKPVDQALPSRLWT